MLAKIKHVHFWARISFGVIYLIRQKLTIINQTIMLLQLRLVTPGAPPAVSLPATRPQPRRLPRPTLKVSAENVVKLASPSPPSRTVPPELASARPTPCRVSVGPAVTLWRLVACRRAWPRVKQPVTCPALRPLPLRSLVVRLGVGDVEILATFRRPLAAA